MSLLHRAFYAACVIILFPALPAGSADAASVAESLARIDIQRGIVAVVGLPEGNAAALIQPLAKLEITIWFQSGDAAEVAAVRTAAGEAGLLGSRVFAAQQPPAMIRLADNLADGILVAASCADAVDEGELFRALRPQAMALVGDRKLVKPVPDGYDDWSHPYHGPDNNPQSNDRYVRGEFRTQFIGMPQFSPMPEQSVIAGGRIFKAMGHIAHKANQNEMLNTLLCISAYNGTILWRRKLSEGFMIHRNTMVATDDALYMGDHESCKVIDARTGEVRREITIDPALTDGPVWKWMALRGDILYALVGNPEVTVETLRSVNRGLGHWPWGMWKGHDYADPRTAFGYGRTLVAVDRNTGKLLWHYRDDEFLDARAVCMKNDRLYCMSPGKFLLCVSATDGKLLWRNQDDDLLEAIGPNERAQHFVTGYATTCYMKCNDDYLFFAGPQRKRMVVASTKDGKLKWTHDVGNLQLVLRDEAIYAAGPQQASGVRLDYASGKVLSSLPGRRACTRATGCVDSIFYRAAEGTMRVMTESSRTEHIAPMRPPCQDGVLIANGHLYWGPWMCGCALSLYGNIGLSPVQGVGEHHWPPLPQTADEIYEGALTVFPNADRVAPLGADKTAWTAFRGDAAQSDTTPLTLPQELALKWTRTVAAGDLPTAPVAAGGIVFTANRLGTIQAHDGDGAPVWTNHVSGAVYYPPVVAHDRVYVGSADGRVYAYEARTGRPLWSFRVAPAERVISMFGKLISAWPVAGGVAVHGDTVYAAAGLTHYDGTYVVALDARTGRLKASNVTSGALSPEVNGGVSLQGELQIAGGELRFLGGSVYETARYDLTTLKCLNEPLAAVSSQFRTAFYPYYPTYGKYVSLDHRCGDGNVLCHDAGYDGAMFGNLALQSPPPSGIKPPIKDAARDFLRRRGVEVAKPADVWRDKLNRRFTSFVISGDELLATFHPDDKPKEPQLVRLDIRTGADREVHSLPADAVKGGTAVDVAGHVFVTLENGQLTCFQGKRP
ncbi:MAG: PQQ-binding-like beta-propeller repeat protein [Planctomycetaceae bacterium]|nr:PQQ-binding-like beta-propeller repeat protein [Planctomycetaceae bacterium]